MLSIPHTDRLAGLDRRLGTIALILLCEGIATSYALAAFRSAGTTHFWVDEVLAVWAARLPSAGDVTNAIWNGVEFSPPTYDLLLHGLFRLFGADPLVARAPSIVAMLVAALAIGRLVATRLGAVSGALAYGLMLTSTLFDFALQARPYALLVALGALAALLWSHASAGRRCRWQAAGLALLLFASISLHFYAVTTLGVFAVLEATWALRHKRLRWPIWLALAGTGIAAMVWLPLMLHLAAFNAGDTAAPAFYAAPTLDHLSDHAFGLFTGGKIGALALFATILLGGSAMAAASVCRAPRPAALETEGAAQIALVGFALVCALPIGFAFALLATHVFSARYALLATPGAILLMVLLLARLPHGARVGSALLPLLCLLPLLRPPPADTSRSALALLAAAPDAGPIAVGDGNLFLELMESADPRTRARLVYLSPTPGGDPGDTSAEHQLLRLKRAFRPDLPVFDPVTFRASTPAFQALWRPTKATDGLGPWLVANGQVAGIRGQNADVMLLAVKTRSDAQRP